MILYYTCPSNNIDFTKYGINHAAYMHLVTYYDVNCFSFLFRRSQVRDPLQQQSQQSLYLTYRILCDIELILTGTWTLQKLLRTEHKVLLFPQRAKS